MNPDTKRYWIGKMERKKIAERHARKMGSLYYDEILKSVLHSKIFRITEWYPEAVVKLGGNRYEKTTQKVIDADSVTAIFNSACDKNVCVMNFSSYKNPGGQFLNGSSAQEESLCHESNLFNVLENPLNREKFYDINKRDSNRCLYTNAILWTPDIVFLRDGIERKCNVITCAAPNATAAQKYYKVPYAEIRSIMEQRIALVLLCAVICGVDVLIAGAYGCGVFGNTPQDVANTFKTLIDTTFNGCFKEVIYAVPSWSKENYEAFITIFNSEVE